MTSKFIRGNPFWIQSLKSNFLEQSGLHIFFYKLTQNILKESISVNFDDQSASNDAYIFQLLITVLEVYSEFLENKKFFLEFRSSFFLAFMICYPSNEGFSNLKIITAQLTDFVRSFFMALRMQVTHSTLSSIFTSSKIFHQNCFFFFKYACCISEPNLTKGLHTPDLIVFLHFCYKISISVSEYITSKSAER